MKKFIMILAAIICFGISANAQEFCKIKGSDDSVVVTSCYIDGSNAIVTLSNDSRDTAANVTVAIEVVYSSGSIERTKPYPAAKGRAGANADTVIKFPIDATYPNSNFVAKSVRVTSISGIKCE